MTRLEVAGNTAHDPRKFERILVATGDESEAESLLPAIETVAEPGRSTVHVLYVVDTRSAPGHWDIVVERRERAGERAVEALVRECERRELTALPHFRYGAPQEAIPEYAADHAIELIVLGARRRRGFSRLVHRGSVATAVRRSVDVPVLTVPLDG